MKRGLLVFGVLFAQLAWLVAPVAAQSDLLFGEQHTYSVTMRGNGEAVVTARIVFTNTEDQPQTTFAFEIPGLKVADLLGYQQQIVTPCAINYLMGTKESVDATGSAAPDAGATTKSLIAQPCDRYAQPDYTTYYYGTNNSTYTKLKFKDNGGGKYEVTLPTPVAAQQTTALLLGYSGTGYTTSVLGSHSFNFQTIKVSQRVKSSTVAVDVDSGQYLLGGKSNVNYKTPAVTSARDLSVGANASSAESSKALDSIAYGIGQGGGISKETQNLAPGETLSVRGSYADAAWKLHPWRIAGLVLFGIGLLALAAWLVMRLRRRSVAQTHTEAAKPVKTGFADPLYVAAGLGSAVLVGLLTWGLTYYTSVVVTSAYGAADTFMSILVAIVSVCAYVLVVVGPVIWLAVMRRDWRVALYVFVWQVVWLLALILVYRLGVRPLFLDSDGAPIIQPMGGGVSKPL